MSHIDTERLEKVNWELYGQQSSEPDMAARIERLEKVNAELLAACKEVVEMVNKESPIAWSSLTDAVRACAVAINTAEEAAK